MTSKQHLQITWQHSHYFFCNRASVRLGEHDIRTNPDCQLRVCAPKVQDRHIKISKKHPQFDKPPFHNDIAILELESPVEINSK